MGAVQTVFDGRSAVESEIPEWEGQAGRFWDRCTFQDRIIWGRASGVPISPGGAMQAWEQISGAIKCALIAGLLDLKRIARRLP